LIPGSGHGLGITIHGQSIVIGGVWEFDLDREVAARPAGHPARLTEIGKLVILFGEFGSLEAARRAPGPWNLSTGYPQVIHI
jgi:hypothetical protein